VSKFSKGQSGNPAGRPQGSKNARTLLIESLGAGLPDLLEVTRQAALGGDMTAMRLLLDRALPMSKQVNDTVDLPGLLEAGSLTDKATAVLNAIASGDLPPDIGSSLVTAINSTARVAELDALANRISQVEEKIGLADRISRARARVMAAREQQEITE